MISVLILTLDEAVNIESCLASIPWRDDVHVLDSGSTDGTQEIARAMGAQVHHRDFTSYAEQRNAGLSLPFEHPWVLMIDADERLTQELADEITHFVEVAPEICTMAMMRRKDMFLGRWLRRSSGYPSWFPRLMRIGAVRVERAVNEEYVTEGERRMLDGHLLHYPMAKGLDWWFERHNRYSRMEAEVLAQERRDRPLKFTHLLSRDPLERRAAAKAITYRLPARPFLMFLYLYLLRGGFRDGRAGYCFVSMRLAYELMINVKSEAHESSATESDSR